MLKLFAAKKGPDEPACLCCLCCLLTEPMDTVEYTDKQIRLHIRGMFEMNCLFLSGDFKFQVSPKVLISCP